MISVSLEFRCALNMSGAVQLQVLLVIQLHSSYVSLVSASVLVNTVTDVWIVLMEVMK
jgi:hypothetical protein